MFRDHGSEGLSNSSVFRDHGSEGLSNTSVFRDHGFGPPFNEPTSVGGGKSIL